MSNLGCAEFDFGRSTFYEGTYKFKRQWGAVPVPLAWSNLAPSQTTMAETITGSDNGSGDSKVNQIRTLVEKAWSKLPLGVTTTIGPKIRKHISL